VQLSTSVYILHQKIYYAFNTGQFTNSASLIRSLIVVFHIIEQDCILVGFFRQVIVFFMNCSKHCIKNTCSRVLQNTTSDICDCLLDCLNVIFVCYSKEFVMFTFQALLFLFLKITQLKSVLFHVVINACLVSYVHTCSYV